MKNHVKMFTPGSHGAREMMNVMHYETVKLARANELETSAGSRRGTFQQDRSRRFISTKTLFKWRLI
jgi:hypothetical protein